jgi:hypothetical protein
MWKRAKPVQLAIVVLLLAVIAPIGYKFRDFYRDLKKYGGVEVADTKADVLYRLGYPVAVVGTAPKLADGSGGTPVVYVTIKDADPKDSLPPGKRIEDFDEWTYPVGKDIPLDTTMHVEFDPASSKVDSVYCIDLREGNAYRLCPSLAGVHDGDSEEQVKDKLGKFTRFRHDGLLKTIRYDDLGIEFVLRRERVYILRDYRVKESVVSMLWRYVVSSIPTP